MAWMRGYGRGFGRGWGFGMSPWPGRGPFSYLPPWQRPGWLFGRGSCWWLLNPYLYGYGAPLGYGPWLGSMPSGYRAPYWGGGYGLYPPYGW